MTNKNKKIEQKYFEELLSEYIKLLENMCESEEAAYNYKNVVSKDFMQAVLAECIKGWIEKADYIDELHEKIRKFNKGIEEWRITL